MKKNIYIITAIGLAIIATGVWTALSGGFWQSLPEQPENNIVLVPAEKEATLVIDYGDNAPNSFQIDFYEGATVFDVLKNKTQELGLNLKTKEYDIGILIEAIGEKQNGQEGKYWLYYVNGEPPMVAADKLEIKPGDEIEFKFEKSSF
ncbi:MAG: DUF4430 domain-containing protein [Candidatus Staskawiczbacteria bacterium]|nr:DUF4430 domain-containing protein [Candidatus Staskawiczbacteria bacterium]